MSDRVDSLKALREKVRVGERIDDTTAIGDIDYEAQEHLHRAFDGSLDAAAALHDAVLPGWHLIMWGHVNFAVEVSDPRKRTNKHSGVSDNPARAWLLAILSALIAIEEGKA